MPDMPFIKPPFEVFRRAVVPFLETWTDPGVVARGRTCETRVADVRRAPDGTVVDAYRDRLWGNTIVIEHADGMRSPYCGLNTLQLVQTGEPVEGGAVISSVGDTAACESEMPWHLHFSLERGEKSVDVEKFMEAHGCGLKKQRNNV